MPAVTASQYDGGSRRTRDPRLDFFRGLGMFIILYAHTPNSIVADWIPARFGFSDATEIFVFCSGMASAYAFGREFELNFAKGLGRILRRLRDIYLAHIMVFLAILAMLGLVDHFLPGAAYLRNDLNLGHYLDNPLNLSLHFLTLTYVPNYFDILPMYLVILAMVPVMMLLARWSPRLAMVVSLSLWCLSQLHLFDFPAEPWSDRNWFFDGFGWQLVFFTGFGLAMRWFRVPDDSRLLMLLSVLVLVASAPFSCHYGFSCYAGWGYFPWLGEVHKWLFPLIDKTHLGFFRVIHFFALAYVTHRLVRNHLGLFDRPAARLICRVGTQTLPVFLWGLVFAKAFGVVLDIAGHGPLAQAVVAVMGAAALIAVAEMSRMLKSFGKGRAATSVPLHSTAAV